MQKLFRSLIAVGSLAGLAACGDDVSVTAPPPTPLTISGAPVTAVSVGAKVQLSASEAATWASSASNIASVDGSGLVTAVAAGTASITATATADVNRKATVTITVVAPAVRSVTVSPPAVTMNPGGTQGFVANVDADAGVARTVTWTSSNNAVVTVTSAGVATAVAPGAATITATSTANTSVSGAASVTVRTPTAATVTIEKVTVGNTNTPVNFLAVAGQIDVTVNVDPGDFILSKVELLIDGVVCQGCTQTFTAAQSQALSAAAVYGDEIAGAVSQILFSVQTAAFNTTTGVANWLNTNHTVSAKATLTNAGATSTASSNRDMTFANVNTWVASAAFTGTTASATGTQGAAAGLAYRRGGLTVTVLPVVYNAGQNIVAAGSLVRFGSGCDASGTGQRNVPLTGTGPYTAAFPQTSGGSVAAVNSVSNYEFNSAGCALGFPLGETPVLTASDNAGNNIFNSVSPCQPGVTPACPANSLFAVRLDNRAPGVPQFAANPNGRQNGWINDVVGLNGSNTSATDNDWIINGTADAGIGGGSTSGSAYQRWLRIGDGAAGTVDAARAATASDAATLPAPTATNISQCAIATARDELGNESSTGSNGDPCLVPPVGSFVATGSRNILFGVDIDEPTITATAASLASGARLNGATLGADVADPLNPSVAVQACSPNCEFIVTVADAGVIGVSGMLAGTPVKATVIRREATGTIYSAVGIGSTSDCVIGVLTSSGTVCSLATTDNQGNAALAVGLPLVNTLIAGQTIDGFYTFNGRAFDAAGNFTDLASAIPVVHDDTPPSLTTALFNVPLSGGTVVFNANSSDNLDLWFARYTMTYGGGLAGPLIFPDVQLNTFNAATLMNSNVSAGITVNGFMRQVENVTANGPLTVGGAFKPTNLAGNVFDQGNNASVTANTAIPGASVTNGNSYILAPANPPQQTRSWAISTPSAAVNISANNVPVCGAVTPATPTNVLLTTDALGPTATYNAPFSRVDFYVLFGGNLVHVGTGSQQAIFDDGSAFGRRHRWTFDWTPGATYGCAPTNLTIYAVGVNAAGDGLVTLSNTNITIVP
jgi:predicted small lipoprotein YifL